MIFVSAGHYPAKPGACHQDFCEHEEALVWVSLITNHIGSDAIVVPPGVLRKKVEFINERALEHDVAIEIHFNSAVNGEGQHIGQGSETLYYPTSTRGKHLAKVVQNKLAEHCTPDRGAKEGWYKMDRANGPDFFLARTKCTALIIEPDFIHRKYFIHKNRDKACTAIARALLPVSTSEG